MRARKVRSNKMARKMPAGSPEQREQGPVPPVEHTPASTSPSPHRPTLEYVKRAWPSRKSSASVQPREKTSMAGVQAWGAGGSGLPCPTSTKRSGAMHAVRLPSVSKKRE